jgi:trehalose synthase
LSESDIDNVLYKYGIDKKKPIVTQIARFDYLKDQEGVLEAFKMLKRYVDAQLILAGTRVPDDPESEKMLVDLKAKAKDIDDIHILVLPSTNADIEINALQRASSVIVQKPIKEGFGLAVTEALWKTKPVVASAVGGIPLQIKHKHSGLLCHSVEGAALEIRQFLHNPAFAKRLAHNGMLHVKHNFLITRLIMEHMLLIISLSHDGDVIIL